MSIVVSHLPLMDSFTQIHQNTGFRYNPNLSTADAYDDAEFQGIVDIFVHHARNIHRICIYDNQDVYAKFSLTYNPDETLSTRIINGGGKNPTFNENLRMKVTQMDAVLKCEIWMFSRSRNHLEDQLLGFSLVQIPQVYGKGKVTQQYSLSSTELFHSPAGTIQLTLSLDTSFVLLDRKISQVLLDQVEYASTEFPDISVVKENQQMVSEYFNLAATGCISGSMSIPFLHLCASPELDDCEMTMSSPVESISPNESIQNSMFLSSTTTSLSDDKNSADLVEKRNHLGGGSSTSINVSIIVEGTQNLGASPDTPTSNKVGDAKEANFSSKEKESKNDSNIIESAKFGEVFSAPLGNINIESEQNAMQQQIVDMYIRSMQQFTESLAKMKLPMDLNKPEREGHGDLIQTHDNSKLDTNKRVLW
ncbi:unnamed protein product [Lupinus luteus]|uniref:C2 domain-containing protein n=1 Tax=Lupinus luteus TaxID=3873 RepID=A0AAV1X414_LUPLU